MKLILRAHHLLCLQGFQGYGYDRDFVINMTKINNLRKQTETQVEIVNFPDDICQYCPNLKDNICENEKINDEIIAMDNEVLAKLPDEKVYNSLELFKLVKDLFSSIENIKDICLECCWWKQCLFVQKLNEK